MKKIFFIACIFIATSITLMAGNGAGTCPCSNNVNIYAAGVASWVSSTQIQCNGEAGTCWELKYHGGWVLTIFVEPPLVFGSNYQQSDPPPGPTFVARGDSYVIYEIDMNIWKEK